MIPPIAKILILIGAMFIVAGLLMWVLQHTTGLGKLPGDIVLRRGSMSVYLPITTSVIISIIMSVLLGVFIKYTR